MIKAVVLDGYIANPGDISWQPLAEISDLTVYPRTSPDDVVERCKGAEAVFVNKVVLDANVFKALPDLKFVGVLATGYNNIDLDAARKQGVTVCNVPAYSSESVAQTVFALLLEVTNRVGEYSAKVCEGKWQTADDFSFTLGPISELSGLTMGIYGLGNIGKRVAAIANSFGMKVVSPTSQPAESLPAYVEKVTFDEFLEMSDVISINAPLTKDNRHIFNSVSLARTRPGVIIINTARGPLIDENALAEALRSAHVGGAGLDVLEQEPPRNGSPLIGAPNCYITPHVAWQSVAARRRLIDISASNLQSFIDGNPVNVVS